MAYDACRNRAAAIAVCVLAIGLGWNGQARAEDDWIKPGTETWKIDLGGIINDTNTSLRLDGPRGRGTEFDLEGEGLKHDVSSFFAAANWRFAANHRIGLQVFEVKRDATKAINETIDIKDQVIPVGTTLSSESKTQFLIADYQYSFIRNDNLEFAGMIGLYGARFKFRFGATNPVVDVDASTTAPLPMFGLSLDYFFNPRWSASAFGQGLKVKIGDVDGSVYNVGVSTDYMLTRHFGVGIGYNLTDLKVDLDKNDFHGRVGWRMNSFFGYAQAKF
jgi:hypothetical protein